MWIYKQKSGQLWHDDGKDTRYCAAEGYAGHAGGKNNPDLQHVKDIGPLPRGGYTISAPHDTPTHGPYVLTLTPDPANEMFGRAGFLIHGDSKTAPGTASHGCIIFGRIMREKIWDSGDHWLHVEAE